MSIPCRWDRPNITGAPLPQSWGHQICAKDGNIYILSRLEGTESCQVHIITTLLPTWRCAVMATTGDTPPGIDSLASVLYGDNWFLFGGTDGVEKSNRVYALNLRTRTWWRPPATGVTPSPRDGHCAVLLGDDMYVFGGNSVAEGGQDQYMNDLNRLDLRTFEWEKVEPATPSRPCPRDSCAAAAWQGRLVVVGGDDTTGYLRDVWVFDPANRTWAEVKAQEVGLSPQSPPPLRFQPRASHSAVALPAGVVVFGGDALNGGIFGDCWLLELGPGGRHQLAAGEGRWTQLLPAGRAPEPRFVHAATAMGDAMIISGGTGTEAQQILSVKENESVFADLYVLQLGSGTQPQRLSTWMIPGEGAAVGEGPGAAASGAPVAVSQQQSAVGARALTTSQAVPELPPPSTQYPTSSTLRGMQAAAGTASAPSAAPVAVPSAGATAGPMAAAAAAASSAGGRPRAGWVPGAPASELLAGVNSMVPSLPPATAAGRGGGRGGAGRGSGAKQAKQRTSYNVYQWEQRPKLKAQHPNLDYRAIESMLSTQWGSMTKAEKEPYRVEASKYNLSIAHLLPERKRKWPIAAEGSSGEAGPDATAATVLAHHPQAFPRPAQPSPPASQSIVASQEQDAAAALLGMDGAAEPEGSQGQGGEETGGSDTISIGEDTSATPAQQQMQVHQQEEDRAGQGAEGAAAGQATSPARHGQQHATSPQQRPHPSLQFLRNYPMQQARQAEQHAQQPLGVSPPLAPPGQYPSYLAPRPGQLAAGQPARQQAQQAQQPQQGATAPAAAPAPAPAEAAPPRPEVVSLGLYAVSRDCVGCRISGTVDGVWGEGTQGGYTAIVELNGVRYRALLTSPFLALQPPAGP